MAARRLSRFWDDAQRHNGYRGWGTELPLLHRAVRKDGLAHITALGCLYDGTRQQRRRDTTPRAWVLPHSRGAWHREASSPDRPPDEKWIFKPAVSSCGEGLVVGGADVIAARTAAHGGRRPGVVQRYEDRPRLIGGLKFDLRCYVVCVWCGTCDIQPHFYLFADGLARFATVRYDAAPRGEGGDTEGAAHSSVKGQAAGLSHSQHLTNYTVNSQPGQKETAMSWVWRLLGSSEGGNHEDGFLESEDGTGKGGLDDNGNVLAHKWSAASALLFMSAERKGDASWAAISELVTRALTDVLRTSAARRLFADPGDRAAGVDRDGTPAHRRAFELVGVDVLFDAGDAAHLLELQRRPDLAPTSPLDLRVKTELLAGLDALLVRHRHAGGAGGAAPACGSVPDGWFEVARPACDFDVATSQLPEWAEWRRIDEAMTRGMEAEAEEWAASDAVWRARDDRWLED